MRSEVADAWRRHKFAALLVLLLVALSIQSFDAQLGAPELLSDTFRTVLAVAILIVVFERSRERVTMASILAGAIATGWWRLVSDAALGYALSLMLYALLALFLWGAVCVILRDLFQRPAVGAENVLGAICGYLIAGDAWGSVNAFAYVLTPAAYNVNPDVSALLVGWHGRMALFSYYSFAQMLTIGYSDVTPVRAPATTLSLLGALSGLFYTAVVVSQLVRMAQPGKGEAP